MTATNPTKPSRRHLRTLQPPREAHMVYHGPSMLDPSKTVLAVATGLGRPSKNSKTGPMAQVWILSAAERPTDAQRTGSDASVCGDCPMRPKLRREALAAGQRAPRYACYVNTGRAPNRVWDAWQAGRYQGTDLTSACEAIELAGRSLRLGAYGDPAALPLPVLDRLTAAATAAGQRWTAYTHQWRHDAAQGLKSLAMASCETPTDVADAERLGWRAFVVVDGRDYGEQGNARKVRASQASKSASTWLGLWAGQRTVACPNVTHGTTCADCGLCDGARHDKLRAHIAIAAHL